MNDTPEEPEEAEQGSGQGGGTGPDEPEPPLRGWIDPEDRLWRHPSEVTGAGGDAGTGADPSGPVFLVPPRHPYRGPIMILVGVVAVFAVVAWVVILLSPASQRPLRGGTHDTAAGVSLTTLAGPQNAIPAVAQAAGRSIVQLQATTAHGTVRLIGVAVAEGGLVVTTADLLVGVQRIVMFGPAGQQENASIVGTDKGSDVALVNVPVDLPVAPFADASGMYGGSPDLTLSFVPAGQASLALHCTPGTVTGAGAAITGGPGVGMPTLTSSAAAPSGVAGDPLLNASGAVVGILYDPEPGTSSAVTFLPSQLVVGVADDLRSNSKVVSGCSASRAATPPNGSGALVDLVKANGPAAQKLHAGDVVAAINSVPVRTMAELRARIYVLAPGTTVALSLRDGGGVRVVGVTLGGSS